MWRISHTAGERLQDSTTPIVTSSSQTEAAYRVDLDKLLTLGIIRGHRVHLIGQLSYFYEETRWFPELLSGSRGSQQKHQVKPGIQQDNS